MPSVPPGSAHAWIGSAFGSGRHDGYPCKFTRRCRPRAERRRAPRRFRRTRPTRLQCYERDRRAARRRVARGRLHPQPNRIANTPIPIPPERSTGISVQTVATAEEAVVRFRYDAPDLAAAHISRKPFGLAAGCARLASLMNAVVRRKNEQEIAMWRSTSRRCVCGTHPTFITTRTCVTSWPYLDPAAVDRSIGHVTAATAP